LGRSDDHDVYCRARSSVGRFFPGPLLALIVAAYGVGPPIVVYAIGWTVAWVGHGFIRKSLQNSDRPYQLNIRYSRRQLPKSDSILRCWQLPSTPLSI
jgi:hypothetical protein